jgi:hypothetical protein
VNHTECTGQKKSAIDLRLESMKEGNWWTFKALLAKKYLNECLDWI